MGRVIKAKTQTAQSVAGKAICINFQFYLEIQSFNHQNAENRSQKVTRTKCGQTLGHKQEI